MATTEQSDYAQIMATTVGVTCSKLTDIELNSIYMCALLGMNPDQVGGYDRIKSLFTEDNGTRMHQTTLDALGVVWESRCGKEKTT
jgi:hypothetical protein